MSREYTLNLVGDVMLGRLIDQLLPNHVEEPSESRIISRYRSNFPDLRTYTANSPWGNAISLFHSADLNLINLETSVTTHPTKWPDKVFNYRMHPANVEALKVARIDYASLANNHTLDFGKEGLVETVRTLKHAGLKFAGAGESREEAIRPATLLLPRPASKENESGMGDPNSGEHKKHTIDVYSASDHPSEWSNVPSFHLIDYSASTRARLKTLLLSSPQPSLKIFSVHWGPNYSWHPSLSIHSLAHFLIDECGVDIIHGHSPHHVQGVENYKGRLILYGCGDFVDDYAVTPDFRNDLSAVWRVAVEEEQATNGPGEKALKLKRLEIFPSRIRRFQVEMLEQDDPEYDFVCNKIVTLTREFGTEAKRESAAGGQLVVDL